MSTKTIALDSRVYRRLAAHKRDAESFSRVISRILDEVETAHTGADVLARLKAFAELSEQEASTMQAVVDEARSEEDWDSHDLR